MTRVLVINENELFGQGIKQLLEKESDFKVTFLQLLSKECNNTNFISNFDVYLLESTALSMEIVNRIFKINVKARIVMFYDKSISHLKQLASLGISGFIKKSTSITELILTLQLVKHGHASFPLPLLEQLIATQKHFSSDGYTLDNVLTKKELEILHYIAAGKNNREISEELFMSVRSIEYHLTKIFKKLSVNSRVEALSKAISLNIISIN
ncbi:response regulator transcription factor [Mesobacillus jeotgali]|uniref:response regulator transcription factor n=1 Tax=Mesobacillus jeotgali TaxID=129985 RepID=UPI000C847D08|nr:response regulator transcription factor [Mesobacillus jeotgali]